MKRIAIYLKDEKQYKDLRILLVSKGKTVSAWVRKCAENALMWEENQKSLRKKGY